MRILHLSPRVPFPPSDGGSIGIYNIVMGNARAGHEVSLVSANTPKHYVEGNVLEGIKQYNVSVNTRISLRGASLNLFKSLPYIVERFVSRTFERELERILKENQFDVIQFEGTFVAWYIDVARKFFKGPIIIRAHNVETTIWERLAQNEKNILKKIYYKKLAYRLKKFESKYYQKFDGIAAITKEDEQRFRKLGITKAIKVIPAGVEMEKFITNKSILLQKRSLLMIGALDWIPNQEGLIWFLDHVWKKVIEKHPDLEFHVAGKGTPDHFMKLDYKNLIMHGFVDSASEFMQQYDLMVVPLLSGGGMRIKIIEGMALGKVMITTKVGAEGIEYTENKNILLAENPDEWVNKILDYFKNPELFNHVSAGAKLLIDQKYSNQATIDSFHSFYKEFIR